MKNRLTSGFSLMELAIVLIVMGLVLGAAMPSVIRYRQQAAIRETKDRQELVTQAVAAYVALRGDLPCPADPATKVEPPSCMAANKVVGLVPCRLLGLPESMARDGFGRFMTYAIPVTQFKSGAGHEKFCGMTPQIPLNLQEKGAPVTPQNAAPALDYIALILISHGPGGHGAFTGQGSNRMQGDSMSREEQANSDSTLMFYDQPFGAEGSAKPFRHIVKWVTARNLMGIYAKTPCTQTPPTQPPMTQNHDPWANPFERGKK